MSAFEQEFNQFMRQEPNCAVLSDLLKSPPFKNADYLLKDREIVAELKSLELDTTPKLQTYAEYIIKERSIVFYGALPFHEIIKRQPDKDKLSEQAFRFIIRPIERMVKEANRQIRETKRALRLPQAAGLMILANTGNILLDWNLVQEALLRLLRTKGFKGRTLYSNIGGCLYLSEMKRDIKSYGRYAALPVAFIQRINFAPGELVPLDLTYIEQFRNRWATWRGVPVLNEDGQIIHIPKANP